jgi:hypothetical protein
MNPIYLPLLSALAGAIVGSASSIATIVFQAKIGERRERIRQAMTLAMEDLKLQVAHARPGTAVFPISIYLHHQMEILKAIEEEDLTPARFRKIANMDDALIKAVKDIDDEFRSKMKQGAPSADG